MTHRNVKVAAKRISGRPGLHKDYTETVWAGRLG
jgi:hypothetical protein